MKTIKVTENSLNLEAILNLASKENILLETPEGREFVLAEIDNFDREVELTRQNQELMNFLDERSREQMTLTLNQVRQQLGLENSG
jgi:hypothetical protein